MQPLPLKASQDILRLMHYNYHNQGFQLYFSFFEIYGGKLYDLLGDRRYAINACLFTADIKVSFYCLLLNRDRLQKTLYEGGWETAGLHCRLARVQSFRC